MFVKLVYATDPLEVTWTFISGFFNQEQGRGITVDSWITEYNRLHNDKDSRLADFDGKLEIAQTKALFCRRGVFHHFRMNALSLSRAALARLFPCVCLR